MAHSMLDLPIDEMSVPERLSLLDRLWDSLLDIRPIPAPAWHADEVKFRIAAADEDPDASISLEDFERELKEGRP